MLLLQLFAGFLLAQSAVSLTVTGDVKKPLTLTSADFARLPRTTIAAYEGVLLSDVLNAAGFASGSDLPGYVVATATDGYRAVFSLGEIDPTVSENRILVADKVNGAPLSGRDGTFRLVAPRDIRSVRSVRMLTSLQVVLLPEK
jgi:DMSO/TMAO reductase YedYZ molybdopterin-dependent catalytic subunit